MSMVELRSDTFTTPSPEMRRAMADAEVGDDEYGEDPTVNRLQSLAAALLGTEAALYTPSGTMANQLAIRVLARPGTEVLCPARSHVYQYELAASPQNSGVQLHPLWDVPDGIVAVIEGMALEFPPVSMLTLENTYMAMSGAPTGADEMRTLVGIGQGGGLRVHVDGARIWNAAIATGVAPSALVGGADTVMFCLSKGLGAPVGSVLCGPADVIVEARVQRRKLGGGMRQAGVIAAAGIVALETMVERLADDHRRARVLADVLADRWPGSVDPAVDPHEHRVCATRRAARALRRPAGRVGRSRRPDRPAHRAARDAQGRRRRRRDARPLPPSTGCAPPDMVDDGVPRRVLAIYAHPDDAEISAGGTLARWADVGADVHILITTRGDKGTDDPDADLDVLTQLRIEEAAAAARVLGATPHHLAHPDGELTDDRALRLELVRGVREVRPDVVCCPDPTAVFFGDGYINHRDHRITGWAALDAVAPASGNPHYFPELRAEGLAVHSVAAVYLSGTLEPNSWVDITATLERKIEALFCHASQLVETGDWFRQFLRDAAEQAGRAAGVTYAEAFRRIAVS